MYKEGDDCTIDSILIDFDNISHKAWNDIKNIGVFLQTSDGHIMGRADETRWDNAKWYQKIIGRISYRYKHKFIDILPLELDTSKHE